MRSMRYAAAALAVLVSAPAAAQTLPDARQVLDRYVEAVGGRAAVERPQSRHAVYELEVGGMTMKMEIRAARPNRTVVTMSTPIGDMVSG
ncbi:MAG TPA: hypothetical protein VFQ45_12560, partial [Longimicrobium sp.]|nr:hypothetical protein [Longimicrobium sp.]